MDWRGTAGAQSAPTTRRDPLKSAAGRRLSADDTSPGRPAAVCLSGCRQARPGPARPGRVYHKTNSTPAGGRHSLSANASSWITASCDDVRPTASALIRRRQRRRRRRPLTSRGPAGRPAGAYISSPCDAPPPTSQINGPQIRTAFARIKRRRRRRCSFCSTKFYDDDDDGDQLFFTFVWLMLIAKIKAATQH